MYDIGYGLLMLFQALFVIGMIVLLIAFYVTHFQNVKRVKHIERILMKQFGKVEPENNDNVYIYNSLRSDKKE